MDEFSNFVKHYFGESYDVDKCKTDIIQSLGDNYYIYEENHDFQSILPDAVLQAINVPNFMTGTDRAYEDLMDLIRSREDMLDDLYEIVREWPEVKELFGKV